MNLSEDEEERDQRLTVLTERFKREATTVSQLRDARTVRVFDYGTTSDGLLYMVMEFVDGRDLSEVVESEGALQPERVVRICDQILASLEEAHSLELIHRDVKPANIMLYNNVHEEDCVKLLDFGLVKSMEADPLFTNEDPGLTSEDNIVGTPRYMSPEQIRGEKLDGRTDLYSLGLVMYELLTGERAQKDDTAMKILVESLSRGDVQLPPGSTPPRLESVVNALLRKERSQRPGSARSVRSLLTDWNAEELHEILDIEELSSDDHILVLEPANDQKRFVAIGILTAILLIAAVAWAFRPAETQPKSTEPSLVTAAAPKEEPEADDGFEFEEQSPLQEAHELAVLSVYEALPDSKILEFAAAAAKETQKTKPKRKKKRRKTAPKTLKIRTLE